MQKKSLLVALFCGALCLTGCLKNEESASVAQVRIAKANELNSIADLNKAKAQAEVIYANAEATIAQADAKLKEAEAAMLQAQAETEKVQAELLKVQVKLAEVKVEEEKVKLQMMEADLESRLAALEVEKAAAEAAIQGWVNVLEDLVAQAEKNAIDNAKEILTAQEELEAYILTQEGKKADSASVYAQLYFQALDSVAKYQVVELEARVAKVLVNRGALDVREYIYEQIEKNNEQIDENNAKIEAYKEYQTMTPEEAKELVAEAMANANAAYTAYKEAQDKEDAAEDAFDALEEKVSLFEGGSKPFGAGDWNHSFINFITANAPVQEKGNQDFEDFKKVNYYGYYVGEGTDKTFVPLWKPEQELKQWALYPSAEEESVRSSFFQVQEMKIAPAEIFYENIEGYLDTIVNRKNREIAAAVKAAQHKSATDIEGWQLKIQTNNDSLTLMKKYVAARQDTISKIESDIATLVAQYNGKVDGLNTAMTAYQEYMVVNYDIRREFFENVFEAEADTVDAHDAVVAAELAYGIVEDLIPVLEDAEEDAAAEETAAMTNYQTVKAVYDATFATLEQNLVTAEGNWNPKFAWEAISPVPDTTVAKTNTYYYFRLKGNAEAGSTQDAWLKAKGFEKLEYERWQAARRDAAAAPTDAEKQARERQKYANYVIAGADVEVKAIYMNAAEDIYTAAKNAVATASAPVTEAAKAWNPKFEEADAKLVVDEENETEAWVDNNGNMPRDTAGTAQAEHLYAQKALNDAKYQIENGGRTPDGHRTLKQKLEDANLELNRANSAYERAFAALLAALRVDEDEYEEDPEVRRLYEAQEEAEGFHREWLNRLGKLQRLYGTSVWSSTSGNWNEWTYIAPEEPYSTTGDFNQRLGLSWILSNYHIDPNYEYIKEVKKGEDGKYAIVKEAAAILLGYTKTDATTGKTVGNPGESISYKNIALNKFIADEPARLAQEVKLIQGRITPINEGVAAVKAALKEFPAYEDEYNAWVEDRQEAFDAWNKAKKDVYDANLVRYEAEAEFDAAKAAANGGVVYEIDWRRGRDKDYDYKKVSVNKAIKDLEDENEALEEQNDMLRQTLSDGKAALQVVNQIIDEVLERVQEAISIWNAIANKFKAIMNGYLGIVDEADVEGETGPLDGEGEGDDEE